MTAKISRALLAALALAACTPAAPKNPQPSASTLAVPSPAAPLPTETAPTAQALQTLIRIEDPSLVCMVNDQFMGVAQIPVAVEGKTYFGCCAMCKGRLEKDREIRLGVDPVSKQPVDKASAVMARTATGKVLYFENEGSLRSYEATL